jgi:chemotaxis protein histidine kinase CheA
MDQSVTQPLIASPRTARRWVAEAVLPALGQVQAGLLRLSDPDAAEDALGETRQELDRVRAVCELVSDPWVAILAQELARFLAGLEGSPPERRDGAIVSLAHAVDALRTLLRSGHHPSAAAVTIVDDLRAARGAPLLSESAYFMSPPAPESVDGGGPPGSGLRAGIRRLRVYYQRGLAQWLRNPGEPAGMRLMVSAVGHMQRLCGGSDVGSLFAAAGAFLDRLGTESPHAGPAERYLLGQVDRQIRDLAEAGQTVPPPGLLRSLRLYAALAHDAAAPDQPAAADPPAVGRAVLEGLRRLGDSLDPDRARADPPEALPAALTRAQDDLTVLGIKSPADTPGWGLVTLEQSLLRGGSPTPKVLAAAAEGLAVAERAVQAWISGGASVSPDALSESGTATVPGPDAAPAVDGDALHVARLTLADALSSLGGQEGAERLLGAAHALGRSGLPEAARVLEDCAAHLGTPVSDPAADASVSLPSELAEALIGIERYLDALAEGVAEATPGLALAQGRIAAFRERSGSGCPKGNAGAGAPAPSDGFVAEAWAGHDAVTPSAKPPAAPAPVSVVDPELAEIFVEEATAILDDIDQQLSAWQARPTDPEMPVVLRRAFHTLKGSGRMVGATLLADLAWSLERLFSGVADAEGGLTPELSGLLETVVDRLPGLLEALGREGPESREAEALTARVDMLAAQPPSAEPLAASPEPQGVEGPAGAWESLQPPAMDSQEQVSPAWEPSEPAGFDEGVALPAPREEMAQLRLTFVEEAEGLLETCRRLTRQWRAAPDELEPVTQLQRQLHTLKGSARLAEFPAVADLSHGEESVLTAVLARAVPATAELHALMQRFHGALSDMLAAVRSGDAPRPEQELLSEAESLCRTPVALAEPPPRGEATLAPAPGADEAPERIPVPADALDAVANYAGEAGVARTRVMRQVDELRDNLAEMDQILRRARSQLSRMEAETDLQVPARASPTTPVGPFDPLQLDRYAELQQSSRGLSESLADLESVREALESLSRDSQAVLDDQARSDLELRDRLVNTRLTTLGRYGARLRRTVSQTADALGKPAELVLEGADEVLDGALLSRLIAPLEHMLRNAVDHGVESPENRRAGGKPAVARIRLSVAHEGREVVVRLSDDGRGMDLEAIRRQALDRGLIAPDGAVAADALVDLIFEQAFTTAPAVTQISGRGVGLDVVRTAVRQLGGSLSVDTALGRGTDFILRLPASVSTTEALMVRVGEEVYAVPLARVEGVARLNDAQLDEALAAQPAALERFGQRYQVAHLGYLLEAAEAGLRREQGRFPVLLVAAAGEQRVALLVDGIGAREEVLVKPVGPPVNAVGWISGATVLVDGRLAFVLDVKALSRRAQSRPGAIPPEVAREAGVPRRPLVLVVDDSITVRKVSERLLSAHGMDVALARDGYEALSLLEEQRPDVVLLDVEMPHMDGYELAQRLRGDLRHRDLPIIMVTSRAGAKHREQAARSGVDVYIGKPYEESDLLERIHELLAAT